MAAVHGDHANEGGQRYACPSVYIQEMMLCHSALRQISHRHNKDEKLPAVGDFWCSPLEPQSIRKGHFSAQKALFLWLILVYQKTIDVVLPLANRFSIISIRLVSGVVTTNGGFNFLQIKRTSASSTKTEDHAYPKILL